jgi:hypothetical protein
MVDDSDDGRLALISICAVVVIAQSNLLATAIAQKMKLLAVVDSNLKVKVSRKLHDRPIHAHSKWWKMLEKGDCKMVGHAHNKLFRRRFRVPFSIFKDLGEEAGEWLAQNSKKLGDRRQRVRLHWSSW